MWNFIPKEKSLFTNGEDRGIAIGNLFAQLFANFLLNVIDWKVDAVCVRHNRYVDDISFVSKDKEKLLSVIPMLRTELGKLGLRLNEKKFYLQHYSKGAQFTGAVIKPGRVYVANHTINSFAFAVERLGRAAEMGMIDDIKKEIVSVNSYLGIMSHYNEYATKRRIMAKLPQKFYEYCYIEGHFDEEMADLHLCLINQLYTKDVAKDYWHEVKNDNITINDWCVLWGEMVKRNDEKIKKWFPKINALDYERKIFDECISFLNNGELPYQDLKV